MEQTTQELSIHLPYSDTMASATPITIEEMQQEIRTILKRIGKAAFYEQMCEMDQGYHYDEPDPKYWADALKEARDAEQVRRELSVEEYRVRVAAAEQRCRNELYRASKFSCMLWEQLGQSQEYALDQLNYWEDLAKKATEEADHYEYVKYAGAGEAKYEEERMRGIDIALKKEELTAILAAHNTNGVWPKAWWKFNLNDDGGSRFAYTTRSVLVGLIKVLGGTVENTDQWWDELKAAHGQ